MESDRDNSQWYYATLIVKIVVEGDARTVMHANTVLVAAENAEDAYGRALQLGLVHNREDINTQGKRVSISFVGLSELDEIGSELGHGTELFFSEAVGQADEDIASEVCAKKDLWIFRQGPLTRADEKPNYASIGVMDELKKRMRGEGNGAPN
jgi:hypothetical protein